ncbi:ABC-ATPase domain-containing protein [Natroniella sulfidigena]|uniref:ABC-ATPase domain-containing protein n=1 Tax=Natroniella sulfidigena TaxID=723921 RepID=UPI00200B8081|nr:ABC-ATPase domain-containing protein [Natroniella sulfidigena]MCK8816780.1 ABC-ATPase domain-containing protein [Natroniella sulfidigena]
MFTKSDLSKSLNQIDHKGYKAYKRLQQKWYNYGKYQLGLPYVQGDPFATPSQLFIRIKQDIASFPDWTFKNKIRRIATADYLTRKIATTIKETVKGRRGSGKSGRIDIVRTGQEILERTAIKFNSEMIEVRLRAGLPAKGRRILAEEAKQMLLEEIPTLVKETLFFTALDTKRLERHILTTEDQEILRDRLKEEGLVTFIANGSILPRKSGKDDRPLTKQVVPFKSPPELEVSFNLPYLGQVSGMGIKEGITLIVGGGYHGKSTLLQAIEKGVYNHLPGDGRELVVTRENASKIRAEDGRRVEQVNISPFINNLPQNLATTSFSTEDASGSTSQAANIMEVLELGSKLLLIDEDTSATNFMIRDARMQQLVANEQEPITPFIDKVKPLFDQHNASTILVIGGVGDYFEIADQVIMMEEYQPYEVTDKAKQVAANHPSGRSFTKQEQFGALSRRYPKRASIDFFSRNKPKIKAYNQDKLQFGNEEIDLSQIEQLLNQEQTKTIGQMLAYAQQEGIFNQETPLLTSLIQLNQLIDRQGLEVISPFSAPEDSYVRPRLIEVGAALNRLRSLKISKIEGVD